MLKAVIFDMDGVLIESEPLHFQAEKKTLSAYHVFPTDEELRSYMGQDNRKVWRTLIQKYNIDTTFEQLYARHRLQLLKLYDEQLRVIDGALEFIDMLSAHDIKLALATSTEKVIANLVMNKLDLQSKFKIVVAGDEVCKGKPDPEIYSITLKKLNLKPETCIVLEDSPAGVQSAQAAGLKCIGFQGSEFVKHDLSRADWIVPSFHELNIDKIKKLLSF